VEGEAAGHAAAEKGSEKLLCVHLGGVLLRPPARRLLPPLLRRGLHAVLVAVPLECGALLRVGWGG